MEHEDTCATVWGGRCDCTVENVVVVVSKNELPNVTKLMETFQSFAYSSSAAGINRQKWADARASLRSKLEELNIASLFDWSEE